MLLLTLRGTPTMYQGDELGMEEAIIPREKMVDPKGINLGVTRDGCRTPMQWDGSEWAGFSTSEPWLPVQDDYMWRNVQTMSPDPRSFLSMVRRLTWLRRETPALNVGSYTPLDGMPAGVFAYVRQHGDQRVLVALNFTGESKTLEAPGTGRVLLNTLLDHEGGPTGSTLNLRGDEGIVIALD
jgi:alpha-glucosidase